ncbi:hypothetical protein OAA26_00225 [bacterium]|nr:hypothetical protein [bacterium]|tara:strand:- start:4127 stop:4585 length:459 start_codon:yes stop_codon:yes gene_type:complete
MALRGLFSGKKVLVTERGLKKNTRYTVKVENLITGTSSVTTKRTKGGKITAGLKIDAKGVVKSTITSPSGETKTQVSVVTADIDCCIAKLVHDAINCTCKCDQCKEDLKLAEKIFLLLQSATYDATLGNTTGATDKYLKAKEFCTERCACGC